jgi:HEAT repeat protein
VQVRRVAVAHGLGTIGSADGRDTLARLAVDPDHLVRAAALEAGGSLPPTTGSQEQAVDALGAPEWQVRVGAVRGLAGSRAADLDRVASAVTAMVEDPFADVRKAAVITLGSWTGRADVVAALERATKDVDAAVRGYARRALAGA